VLGFTPTLGQSGVATLLNSKVMDYKTKPSEIYTTTLTNILDEDNEGSHDRTNGQEQWGEDGVIT